MAAPAPGDQLRPFTLPEADGGSYSWKPGKPAVFSFVAFWCDTWKEQNARLHSTQQALAGLPLDYVTVSIDGRWSDRGEGKVVNRVLLDTGATVSGSLGVHAVPYTLVVDATGRVRYAGQGIVRASVLQDELRELINGTETPTAGAAYVTFDDFPSGSGDEELLDVLRGHGVKATFFCIGRNVAAHPEVVRRAAEEGHALQIHSWDHDAARPELARCARALRETGAAPPTLYRPPGSSRLLDLDGRERRVATVNPYDYTRPGEKELVRRVLLAAKPGSVVLLHAGVAETREALRDIIASLRKRGLEFEPLR